MVQEVMKEYVQPRSSLSINYQSLKFLAAGGSGIVYEIDEKRVLKEFHSEGINVERQALERLRSHANIIRLFGATENGLILERGRSLRAVIQESGADRIPLDRKIRWLQEAAEGTRYMHDNGIVHADVGCHNWIIVEGRIKIIDFEGCSIDGKEAGACYEWFSYKESMPAISRETDIFAFGCAIYEVITGRQPHDALLESDNRMARIKQLYAENQFPQVENMPLSNLMEGCWRGTFNSMEEILGKLEAADLPIAGTTKTGFEGMTENFFNILKS
jgi:serine/threonine protein kinase